MKGMRWLAGGGFVIAVAGAAAVAGAGCGPEATCGVDNEPPTGPPWVEVGTGLTAFAALADGDRVQIERGIQGGYMVPLALRAGGLVPGAKCDPDDARNPHVAYRLVRVITGAQVGESSRDLGLSRAADGYELIGTWTLFDPSLPTSEYFDQDVRIELEIADTRGVTAQDRVVVRALAPAF
jgi:hypothetical protein